MFEELGPALIVAVLSVSACESNPCPPCPTGALVGVIPAQTDPIASVSTDPPCSALRAPHHFIIVDGPGGATCQVRVQLMSGDDYAFSVELRTIGSGCCPNVIIVVDASVPVLVDAGAGGSPG